MDIIYWWMILVWLVVLIGFLVARRALWVKSHSKKPHKASVPAAHTSRLVTLPLYQRTLKRYQLLLHIALGALIIAIIAAVGLSARPASIAVVSPAQKNRDIMLCLDTSGSMTKVDAKLIDRFSQLVDGFSGQRFGLVVFNGGSLPLLPLTDDYSLIDHTLKEIKHNMKTQKYWMVDELWLESGTSLAGDGLASCIDHLGSNPDHRMQSVIIATDNEVFGDQIISMPQAAALAKKRNVRVYAIDPGLSKEASMVGVSADEHAELKTAALSTGGNYFQLKNTNAINALIEQISKQEAKYFAGSPELATTDHPGPMILIVAIALVVIIAISWRLGL